MTEALWQAPLWPLLRLLLGLCLGLFIASALEAFRLTDRAALLAQPLARLAHFRTSAAAAFSLAFISPASSNALLAEAKRNGEMSFAELTLANIFNSFPAALLHFPTLFFLLWPSLGAPALYYTGLSLCAAFARTGATVLIGAIFLPLRPYPAPSCAQNAARVSKPDWRGALVNARKRFFRRLPRLLLFTVPVYILMHAMQKWGFFALAEEWLARHSPLSFFFKPQALGIVVFSLAAEFGAAIGAAGALQEAGALDESEIVIALLAGNILSTPMRAIRHQLPAYAGFYRPFEAIWLVLANQLARALSMIAVTIFYAMA